MKFKDIFKNSEDYEKIKQYLKDDDKEKFEAEFDEKELTLVPYSRFNEVNNKKNEAMGANEELKKQIEKLEKERTSPEEFKKKTEEIIQGYEEKIKGIETESFNLRRSYAIKEALAGAKAKHPDLLAKQLNLEKIKESDGKFEGINEQITELKKDYSDLFESEKSDTYQDKGLSGSIYSGIRRQSLSEENSKIVDMFKEGFFGENSED